MNTRYEETGFPSSESKRYESFIYWWDISPDRKGEIARTGGIRFIRKDSGHWTDVAAEDLLPLLTAKRQTSRNRRATGGNWRIKVLGSSPDELAIEEPRAKAESWIRIKVKWEL